MFHIAPSLLIISSHSMHKIKRTFRACCSFIQMRNWSWAKRKTNCMYHSLFSPELLLFFIHKLYYSSAGAKTWKKPPSFLHIDISLFHIPQNMYNLWEIMDGYVRKYITLCLKLHYLSTWLYSKSGKLVKWYLRFKNISKSVAHVKKDDNMHLKCMLVAVH